MIKQASAGKPSTEPKTHVISFEIIFKRVEKDSHRAKSVSKRIDHVNKQVRKALKKPFSQSQRKFLFSIQEKA
jgi:cob(I)alamin adenosyltransferase